MREWAAALGSSVAHILFAFQGARRRRWGHRRRRPREQPTVERPQRRSLRR